MPQTDVPRVKLRSGGELPQVGAGLARIAPGQVEGAVTAAIRAGYRHFDTAQRYHNEGQLGRAVRASGVPRDEFFLCTKLHPGYHHPREVRAAIAASIRRLGTGPIDLFLIHGPSNLQAGEEFVDTWRAMQDAWADGLVRAIGVSNFEPWRLEVLAERCEVVPAVNQVEVHPYFANRATTRYGADREILTVAWSPLALGRVVEDPAVAQLASRHGRSPAQVVLRWHVQQGRVVVPKSTVPAELAENIGVFDFTLSDQEIAALDRLDEGEPGRIGRHPDNLPRPTVRDRVRLRTRMRLLPGYRG